MHNVFQRERRAGEIPTDLDKKTERQADFSNLGRFFVGVCPNSLTARPNPLTAQIRQKRFFKSDFFESRSRLHCMLR